jgi:teichuronic acid exporter
MPKDLRSKTLHALSWSFLESAGLQIVQFVISIVLARLLLPEQFGLIAMLTIFIAVAQSFLDSGFGSALVQKQDATQTDCCSIFYFNIAVGIIAAGLLCLAAPWIAAFYDEPLLTPLTCVLSLNIVINSFGLIQTMLLVKHIDFKTQTKVSLIATIISGSIGVTLAVRGFGVWSLAIQQVCGALLRTVLLWFFNTWRPSLIFSLRSLRQMFAFGSRMLASGLLDTIFQNLYLVVIGKLFSPASLGFYTRANSLQQMPTNSLSGMVGRVTFPVFSTVQNDPARLKRGLKKALTTLVVINFPMMIGIAVVARPLVLVLLTEKWAPCVPYLRLLCLVGLFFPLHVINLNLLMAKGRSDLFFRLEVLKKVIVVAVIIVTCRWGIEAMIWGQIVASVACYYLNSFYTGRLIAYPLREQVLDLFPYFGAALFMGAVVHAWNWVPFPEEWALLATQIVSGVIIYTLLCRIFGLSAFIEVCAIFRAKLPFPRPV